MSFRQGEETAMLYPQEQALASSRNAATVLKKMDNDVVGWRIMIGLFQACCDRAVERRKYQHRSCPVPPEA